MGMLNIVRPYWITTRSLLIAACPTMVNFCAVFRCGKRGDRNKGTSFYCLPAIISYQGEQTKKLSEKRQREWLAAIKRQDIKQTNYAYT